MLKILKKILFPPVFEDQERTKIAQFINAIVYVSILLLGLIILSVGNLQSTTSLVLGSLIFVMIGIQIFMRTGRVRLSAILLIGLTWFAMSYMAWEADGIRNASLIAYLILIFLTSLLGSLRLFISFTALTIISLWVLVYAELKGIIAPTLDTPTHLARDFSAIFILIAVLVYLTLTNLNKALSASKENENKLLLHNQELTQFQDGLEKLVNERTSELEENSKKLQTRAMQLQAISEVSQTIALVQNQDLLLPEITNLISERFDFYHTGIFLISKDEKFATLHASNSPGGKEMLAHGHQLEIGKKGIVGRVAQDGKTRIALDVGEDATYFDNPDLPETRSEMALPLKVKNKIIGVLDVQSKRKNVFSQEDIEIFEALANQVAIAIENTRLAEETQKALEEARSISRQYIHQAWTQLAATQQQKGYRYTEKKLHPLSKDSENFIGSKSDIISIPVQLREETIGVLEVTRADSSQTLDEDTLNLIQSVVNRFALALENARLLEETSRRAGRERLVSDITTKIRSTNNPQEMIQTALDELKQALGASKIELATTMPEVD